MMKWGILGTGNMAATFTNALRNSNACEVVAVGSRRQSGADTFAKDFGIPKAYGSYEALLQAPEIDIVYIASTNNLHLENALLALDCGKHVLVEKPFTLNEQQAWDLVNKADEKGLFCMEAMWMRFVPLMQKVREMVDRKEIGALKMITANFGGQFPFKENSRQFDPALGGGALLDLLVYPISLTHMLLDIPDKVISLSTLSTTGVDEQTSAILHYEEKGVLANLQASFSTNLSNDVYLYGDKGSIHIHAPIYRPHEVSIQRFTAPVAANRQGPTKQGITTKLKNSNMLRGLLLKARNVKNAMSSNKMVIPFEGSGYEHQIAAVVEAIQNGQTETKIMPLAASIEIMKIMDTIREQQNITFPQES